MKSYEPLEDDRLTESLHSQISSFISIARVNFSVPSIKGIRNSGHDVLMKRHITKLIFPDYYDDDESINEIPLIGLR